MFFFARDYFSGNYCIHWIFFSHRLAVQYSICVHAGDKLPLVELGWTSRFRFILVGFMLKNKDIAVSVVFDLFYVVKIPWPTVFVWILETEFQCSALVFLFFIWHLGLADICQSLNNVFLICSIKRLAQAFCRMWTCCNRNWQRGWGSQRDKPTWLASLFPKHVLYIWRERGYMGGAFSNKLKSLTAFTNDQLIEETIGEMAK